MSLPATGPVIHCFGCALALPIRSHPARRAWECVAVMALFVLLTGTALAQGSRFAFDASGNFQAQTAESPALPQIVTQPQSQVALPGALGSFFIVAADTRGLAYQWRFNGANISGATGDALLLNNVAATNEGLYSVVLTNSSGSVTSAPAALMIDSDGDGMPDSWEIAHFGNLNQTAAGDFDGDGVSNLQEFLDGTNPADSTSARYRLTILSDGGSVIVSPASASYTNGQIVMLTAIASGTNTFRVWTGDTNTQSNPLSLVMNSNQTVRAVFASAPMAAGLISWWRAESNTVDTLGLNNGVLFNGATFAAGKVGTAFSLDGVDDYVRIPDSPSLRTPSFTLECWVMFNATNGFRLIMGKPFGPNGFDSFALWFTDGFLYGIICDSVGGGPLLSFPFHPVSGQWYHVAYSFDAATLRQQLFLNGSIVASGTGDRLPAYDTQPMYLGVDDNAGLGGYFSGEIDEAAIYNRALTSTEIAAIFNADIAGKSTITPSFVTPSPLPDAVPGLAYAQQIVAAFGAAPLTYSVSAGTLPSGLGLSTNGVISGIPGASGSNAFEVTVTDANGAMVAQTFGLRVLQPASPAGLAGWWRGENNTVDFVGTNNGTWVGPPVYAAGKVGQAFSLNGSSSYVSVPDAPGLHPSSLTLEAWVMFNNASGFHAIITKPLGSGIFDSYILWFNNGAINGGVDDTLGGGPTLTYAFNPVLGQWYHFAYTMDAATLQQALYVNGVAVSTGTSSRVPAYDTHPLLIGSDVDNGTQVGFFAGEIDEPTLYNRALSAAEVITLYNAGAAGKSTNGPYINTPPALPDAIVGTAYSQQIGSVFGVAPVGFATNGPPPPGLLLGSSGLLSGTPTTPGTYSFKVRATDASSNFNDQTFSLRVYAPIPPAADIISWWRGESNALDSIGTNDGTLIGGVTFAPGKVGQAFALNGSSSYVNVPDSPSLRPRSVTLEAWVMFYASGGLQGVFNKPLGNGLADSYTIYLNNGTIVGGMSDTPNSGYLVNAPFVPVVGQWYHLAFTYDATSTLETIYVNGVQVNSRVTGVPIGYDTHPVLLGADIDNQTSLVLQLNGRIDEAAIYGRALSADEIASVYIAGPAGKTAAGPYFTNAAALADGYIGLAYQQTLGTTRGTMPVIFALAEGSLPDGLVINSAGLISGTPTNAGTFNFTVLATDNAGLAGDQHFTIQIYPRLAPAPGMVSWWRGENNALDSFGTNNGTLMNGASFAVGKVGQGFLFDGVNDYVSIPDSPSLRPTSVTVEAWVQIFSTSGTQLVFAKPLGTGTFDSYGLAIQNGVPLAAICNAGGFGTFLTCPYPMVPFQWYHLAFSFDDASRQQVLYVNGMAVASGNAGVSMSYDAHPLQLGADVENGVVSLYLNGQMDEPALYNRALTANEIGQIYHSGTAGRLLLSPYQEWKLVHLNDSNAPDLGDPDGDGYVTLLEYGLAQFPEVADPPNLPVMSLHDYGVDGKRLRVLLQRDPTHNDVTIEVQASSNLLSGWQSLATSTNGLPFQGIGYYGGDGASSGIKTVEIRDSISTTNGARRFMRVKISH